MTCRMPIERPIILALAARPTEREKERRGRKKAASSVCLSVGRWRNLRWLSQSFSLITRRKSTQKKLRGRRRNERKKRDLRRRKIICRSALTEHEGGRDSGEPECTMYVRARETSKAQYLWRVTGARRQWGRVPVVFHGLVPSSCQGNGCRALNQP